MKVCKLCGSTYGDRVDFCFRDGQPLVVAEPEAPVDAPPPPRHAPGLADMLDVPEPGYVQRPPAADPTALPDPHGLEADPGGGVAFDFADEPDLSLPDEPAEDVIVDEGEVLPPPAPLDAPAPNPPLPPAPDGVTAPMPTASGSGGGSPAAPVPVDPSEPFSVARDTTAGGLEESLAAPVAAGVDEDLPGPRELDEGLDPDAMADIARTLSAPDAAPPDLSAALGGSAEASSAPALDELVDDAPAGPDPDADLVTYIGAGGDGGTGGDEDIADTRAEGGGDRKLVLVLFAAAVLLAVVAGGLVVVKGNGSGDDPLAHKPEEVAAPVVEAPAPPAPEPSTEAQVEPAVAEVGLDGSPATPPTPATGGATPSDRDSTTSAANQSASSSASSAASTTPSGATRSGGGASTATPPNPTLASTSGPSTAQPPEPSGGGEDASAASPATTEARSTDGSGGTGARPATPASPQPTGTEATAEASTDSPWEAPAATGRLTVNTVPGGAQVYVDGRPYGSTPLSAELEYGMHTIRVELGGYTSESRTIDVQVPEMAVPFELKPLVVTGTVNIFGPTGAKVLVDGAYVGKIPTSVKLTEGTHTFRVETTEGTSFTRAQEVRFDSGTTVSVTLAP